MNLSHLKQLLVKHRVSQTDLARILGRDKSVVTNLFQGRRQLKAQEVALIARHIGVSVAAVLGVEEGSGKPADSPLLIPFEQEPVRARRLANVIRKDGKSYLTAGINIPYSPRTRALEVPDDSMNLLGILEGDIAVSELDRPCKTGQIVIAEHPEGRPGVKIIIRKYQPPFLTPHSTTSGFKPLNVEKDGVRLIAPLTRLIRTF